jgi:hypothetical protein
VSQDEILRIAWRKFGEEQTPEAALDYCVKKARREGGYCDELGDLTYPEVVAKLDVAKRNKSNVRWAFARAYVLSSGTVEGTAELRRASEHVPMKDLAARLTKADFDQIYGVGRKTLAVVDEVFAYCGLVLGDGCREGATSRVQPAENWEEAYLQMRGSWGEAVRELDLLRRENEGLKRKLLKRRGVSPIPVARV